MKSDRLNKAYKLCVSWFKIDDVDVTSLKGVSLGLAQRIFVFESIVQDVNSLNQKKTFSGYLKRRDLQWSARFYYSLFVDFFKVRKCKEKVDVLYLYDVNNKNMIDNLNAIDVYLSSKCSTVACYVDPAIKSKILVGDKVSWCSYFKFIDVFLCFKSRSVLSRDLKLLRGDFENDFFDTGMERSDVKRLSRRLINTTLSAIKEFYALSGLLKHFEPKCLVLSSDSHRVSNIAVQIANIMGIKTCVVQHGALTWEYGFVPVTCSQFFAWGKNSQEWLLERGVPEAKIYLAGAPSIKNNLTINASAESCIGQLSNVNIFVLPNPVGKDYTKELLVVAIKLAEYLLVNEIVVKLHPSQSDLGFDLEAELDFDANVSIFYSNEDIAECGISNSSVVVVGNSTAGVDAVSMGARILQVKYESYPVPVDFEKYGVGCAVNSSNVIDKYNIISAVDGREINKRQDNLLKACFKSSGDQAVNSIAQSVLRSIGF